MKSHKLPKTILKDPLKYQLRVPNSLHLKQASLTIMVYEIKRKAYALKHRKTVDINVLNVNGLSGSRRTSVGLVSLLGKSDLVPRNLFCIKCKGLECIIILLLFLINLFTIL